MEGTNTGHEDAAGMASVGVRLTAELGHGACAKRPCQCSVMALPLPERWRAPVGGQLCMVRSSSLRVNWLQKRAISASELNAQLGWGAEHIFFIMPMPVFLLLHLLSCAMHYFNGRFVTATVSRNVPLSTGGMNVMSPSNDDKIATIVSPPTFCAFALSEPK